MWTRHVLGGVATIRHATGWPRPLCRRFYKRAGRRFTWGPLVAVLVAVFVVFPAGAALIESILNPHLIAFIETIPEGASVAEGLWLMALHILPLLMPLLLVWFAMMWVVVGVGVRMHARRILRMYRSEPWCLECGYSMGGLGGARVCPECGTGIDRAIARWVGDGGGDEGSA
ncbi:MAG: hypothetical protein ACF8R7_15780 [Phycisphaerales bacterium JB039]